MTSKPTLTDRAIKASVDGIIGQFFERKPNDDHRGKKEPEMEIRFGTQKRQTLTKTMYDTVARHFEAAGYVCTNKEGKHLLRIYPQHEYVNKDDKVQTSRLRVELVGIDLIDAYCTLNDDLATLCQRFPDKDRIRCTLKSNVVSPVDVPDFGFRLSYQHEFHSSPTDDKHGQLLSEWNTTKKTYRFMNRVQFKHPTLPFTLDLSIIRSSPPRRSSVTMHDVHLFDQTVSYEIELELDPKATATYTLAAFLPLVRQQIRRVLSGIQGTPYPIGFDEMDDVAYRYLNLLHGHDPQHRQRPLRTSDFVGPSSHTLQLNHLLPKGEDKKNIRTQYCVTEKADGQRMLLYIAPNHKLYLIDTNMRIMFTGMVLGDKDTKAKFHDTLLDGEYIPVDKHGQPIHVFAAFDLYYHHGKCLSTHWFDQAAGPAGPEGPPKTYRLPMLQALVQALNASLQDAREGAKSAPCTYRIQCKRFEHGTSIFAACKDVLSRAYEYETDGLIFTPMNAAVGGEPDVVAAEGHARLVSKRSWEYSFKWKPPEFNTVDFLVKTVRNDDGSDQVSSYVRQDQGIQQYKTLILHCGYSKKQHGFLTSPLLHVIHDTLPPKTEDVDPFEYRPVPFVPTQPFDDQAKFCHVPLVNGVMRTLEDEVFDQDTIVEFSYDTSPDTEGKATSWKWRPLRVRHDKTLEYLSKRSKNYGNDYHVANNNWTSIHHPVTQYMITTGQDIPTTTIYDDIYYNAGDKKSSTDAMRDFHNLYVKRRLILGPAKVMQGATTLIDYAVGRGGDLPKWLAAKLHFVFGIDVKRDNIENPRYGACARYIGAKMEKRYVKQFSPGALFVVGTSDKNIRSGAAFEDGSRYQELARAIFGQGTFDKAVLGDNAFRHRGIGQDGFAISSCQFAMHYFFHSLDTVHEFFTNVCECTKMHGYFVGTCYDGQEIFRLLADRGYGEKFVLQSATTGNKIVEITKSYRETGFDGDSSACLGYPIHVFQESINQTFVEYLVHFEYVQRMMGHYGFQLVTKEQAQQMGLPNGSGLFKELHAEMVRTEHRPHPSKQGQSNVKDAWYMSEEEKRLSFLNRYFVFQKVRDVDAGSVRKQVDPVDGPKPATTTTTIIKKTGKTVVFSRRDKAKDPAPTTDPDPAPEPDPTTDPAPAPAKVKRIIKLKRKAPTKEEPVGTTV